MPNSVFRVAAALLLSLASAQGRASAVPIFADRYGVSCQTCHSIVPRLNAFGESFRAAGYRWPAPVATHPAIPISVKMNLAYSSAPDSGVPKAVVDEIELLSFGPIGKHAAYRVEQYLLDGGLPGAARDAYFEYASDPARYWNGSKRIAFDVQAGQFTLPLPDDPETSRATQAHYAVYDQTVGENPFDFFEDRNGINAGITAGDVEIRALALHGGDRMLVARAGQPALSLTAFRYTGSRLLAHGNDAFDRRGAGLTSVSGKARTSVVVQTGVDSNAGNGASASSSGSYVQEEWAFSPRFIAVARYDNAVPGDVEHALTISLNYRAAARARITIEGTQNIKPSASPVITAAALFAF